MAQLVTVLGREGIWVLVRRGSKSMRLRRQGSTDKGELFPFADVTPLSSDVSVPVSLCTEEPPSEEVPQLDEVAEAPQVENPPPEEVVTPLFVEPKRFEALTSEAPFWFVHYHEGSMDLKSFETQAALLDVLSGVLGDSRTVFFGDHTCKMGDHLYEVHGVSVLLSALQES